MSPEEALGPEMVADLQDLLGVLPASCDVRRRRLGPAPSHGGRMGPDLLVGPHQYWAGGLEASPVIVSAQGLW